jgi:hypothetical protein
MRGLDEVVQYVRNEMTGATESKAMSAASYVWVEDLLEGLSIQVNLDPPNTKTNDKNPPSFSWTHLTNENQTIRKGEHCGTPDAKKWFTSRFLSGSCCYALQVVTGANILAIDYLATKRGPTARVIFALEYVALNTI